MKKYILLVLVIALFLCTISYATPAENTAQIHAQVYHAVGVNEYGTDILERSTTSLNVPASITQNGSSLSLSLTLDDTPVQIDATLRGRNLSDNLLYFDAICADNSSLEVMNFTYYRNFYPDAAITLNYEELYPNAENILQVYLKVTNPTDREYYFIEFFDFELSNYNAILSSAVRCSPDYWTMMEFEPASREVTIPILPASNNYEPSKVYRTVSDIYYDIMGVSYFANMTIAFYDDIGSITAGSNRSWVNYIEIDEKSTSCPSVPDYETDDSYLYIDSATLTINAPKNVSFISSVMDGVYQPDPFSSPSISVGVSIGPLSASVDLTSFLGLSQEYDYGTTIIWANEVDSQYLTGDNRIKAIEINFGDSDYLHSAGHQYTALSQVQDYGGVAVPAEDITRKWVIDICNPRTSSTYDNLYTVDFPVSVVG